MDNPFLSLDQRLDRMEKLMEQLVASGAYSIPAAAPTNTGESLVTAEHVALHLGKSRQTIMRLAKSGAIPFYKPGKNYMFKLSEVDRAFSSQTPIKRKNKGGFNV